MRVIESGGLGLLELLGPRLISGEDGEGLDPGLTSIRAPERPARGEKSTDVGSFPLRRSSQKSSFVYACKMMI